MKVYFKAWIFLIFLFKIRAQLPPPQSPCPADFTYEPRQPASDKWYGVVLIKSEFPLTGLRLEIQLTSPAISLGNWDGTVSTRDNQLFQILDLNRKIEPGPTTAVRFFVQYKDTPKSVIPALESIRFNGRLICPQETPTTIPPSTAAPEKTTKTIANPYRVEYNVGSANDYSTKNNNENEKTFSPPSFRDGGNLERKVLNEEMHVNRKTEVSTCGRVAILPRPLITYGQKTARGQWPWHGAIYKSVGVDLSYICGTSLIHRQAALTAAHCVTSRIRNAPIEPDGLVLYFGKYHLKIWSVDGVQDKQVKSIIVHPNFSIMDLKSDIAILILTSPTVTTDYVQPVCLWDRNQIELNYIEGKEGTVIGWGYDHRGQPTEELMQAKMPVVSQLQCVLSYPEFFGKFTSNHTFCAGFVNGERPGTSVCNGDSGGGLVFKKNSPNGEDEYWELRGIVSVSPSQKGEEVCDTSHYVVFTDVAKYLDWISEEIDLNINNSPVNRYHREGTPAPPFPSRIEEDRNQKQQNRRLVSTSAASDISSTSINNERDDRIRVTTQRNHNVVPKTNNNNNNHHRQMDVDYRRTTSEGSLDIRTVNRE